MKAIMKTGAKVIGSMVAGKAKTLGGRQENSLRTVR
jgi:hypothetical protein